MRVLVLAPHPDDETIGCGGSILLHAKKGDRVSVVFLTSGELGLRHLPRKSAWAVREAEAKRASRLLRLKRVSFFRCSDWGLSEQISKAARQLATVLKKEKPVLLYLPHPEDGHPDHKAALPIVRQALKNFPTDSLMLRFYEVWTPLANYNEVNDITSIMKRKLKALRTHKSQLNDFDYVRAVTGLNQYRGALAAKTQFAEVFTEISACQL
jgi:LmbE family N-acetylglucosaminyl deacetylase